MPSVWKQRGFTLIEMAVVMVILGLILGTVVPLIVSQVQKEKLSQAREDVRQARDETIGYALSHTNVSAVSACLPPTGENSFVNPSYVQHTQDPWNQRIVYYPYNGTTGGGKNCFDCSSNTDEGLIIKGIYDYDIPNVAVTVVSLGSDRQLDTTSNNNRTKIDASKFDDVIEYVSFNYLCNRVRDLSNGSGGGNKTKEKCAQCKTSSCDKTYDSGSHINQLDLPSSDIGDGDKLCLANKTSIGTLKMKSMSVNVILQEGSAINKITGQSSGKIDNICLENSEIDDSVDIANKIDLTGSSISGNISNANIVCLQDSKVSGNISNLGGDLHLYKNSTTTNISNFQDLYLYDSQVYNISNGNNVYLNGTCNCNALSGFNEEDIHGTCTGGSCE